VLFAFAVLGLQTTIALCMIVICKPKTANYNVKFNKVTNSPARVVQWSYHLGAMCSRACRAQWPRSGVQSEPRPGKVWQAIFTFNTQL